MKVHGIFIWGQTNFCMVPISVCALLKQAPPYDLLPDYCDLLTSLLSYHLECPRLPQGGALGPRVILWLKPAPMSPLTYKMTSRLLHRHPTISLCLPHLYLIILLPSTPLSLDDLSPNQQQECPTEAS